MLPWHANWSYIQEWRLAAIQWRSSTQHSHMQSHSDSQNQLLFLDVQSIIFIRIHRKLFPVAWCKKQCYCTYVPTRWSKENKSSHLIYVYWKLNIWGVGRLLKNIIYSQLIQVINKKNSWIFLYTDGKLTCKYWLRSLGQSREDQQNVHAGDGLCHFSAAGESIRDLLAGWEVQNKEEATDDTRVHHGNLDGKFGSFSIPLPELVCDTNTFHG